MHRRNYARMSYRIHLWPDMLVLSSHTECTIVDMVSMVLPAGSGQLGSPRTIAAASAMIESFIDCLVVRSGISRHTE
jgi:hypothetical protein